MFIYLPDVAAAFSDYSDYYIRLADRTAWLLASQCRMSVCNAVHRG